MILKGRLNMMNNLILSFIRYVQSYGAPDTVRYYRENLSRFDSWLTCNDIVLSELTSDDLRDYITFLSLSGIKNVSVRTYYRAVKAFCRWLYDNDYLDNDITLKIKLPRDDHEIVIPLTVSEVSAVDNYFLSDCVLPLRNYCIFHLMLDCGLRRQEVINLSLQDIKNNTLSIRNTKNCKSRVVLLPDFLQLNISNYVGTRRKGYVFLDKNGINQITESSIKKMFVQLKLNTGIVRLHPHLLRHTFATSYLYYGGNMEMLRLLLGHESYAVIKNYVHLAAQEELIESGLYKLDDIFFKKRR